MAALLLMAAWNMSEALRGSVTPCAERFHYHRYAAVHVINGSCLIYHRHQRGDCPCFLLFICAVLRE